VLGTKHKTKSAENKSSHNKECFEQGHTKQRAPKAKAHKTMNAQSKNTTRTQSKKFIEQEAPRART
jgi:hypothetical protein